MTQDLKISDNDQVSINGVIFTHKDVAQVVDVFYRRVEQDPILQVPFRSVHDWPEHIKRLTHFWWIRFGGKPYMFTHYEPVVKHFFAGFNEELLARWLGIFHEVLKGTLNEKQCQLWTLISERMGEALSLKNEYYKKSYGETP